MEQRNLKTNFVLKISSFESRTANSHNPAHDNCHWQSMCYKPTLGFNISQREIFSKSGSLRVLKKSGKSALTQI